MTDTPKTNERQTAKTANCSKVWDLIQEVRDHSVELSDALADTFCDFECSWEQHAKEYHTS